MDSDYITPPENKTQQENDLTMSIRERVDKDLSQINGVYDDRIKEAELDKQKELENVELCHCNRIQRIEKERRNELEKYSSNATQSVGNLMLHMSLKEDENNEEYKYLYWLWKSLQKLFK